MEDRRLPIVLGPGRRGAHRDARPAAFTLIGATTRTGLLTTPLRERFGVCHRLEHYPPDDLAQIVERSAAHPRASRSTRPARSAIAARARGTPRVANRLLQARARLRRGALAPARSREEVADEALEMLEVDAAGLERLDREILRTIVEKFDGGPVGPLDAGGRGRRGAGHDRGRLRALSAPAGPDQAHSARPRRDARAPTSTSAWSRKRRPTRRRTLAFSKRRPTDRHRCRRRSGSRRRSRSHPEGCRWPSSSVRTAETG